MLFERRDRRFASTAAFLWGLAAAAPALAQSPGISEGPELSADDPTALRLKAADFAAEENYAAALDTIDRALALSPDDLDIRMARARILLWSGEVSDARGEAETVAAIAPDYPELDALQQAIARASNPALASTSSRAAVFASASLSDIDIRGNHQLWTAISAGGYGEIGDRTLLSGAVDYEHRGVGTDVRLSTRLERRIGKGMAYLSATGTPDADFKERWSIGAGGEVPIGRAAATLDYRHAEYAPTAVDIVTPGIRFPLFSDGVTAALKSTALFQAGDKVRIGVSGRLDARIDDGVDLFGGAATYPDTEAGITRQVRGAFAGAAFALTDRLTLRATADYEEREATYARKGVAIGLGWRFGR